MHAVAVEDHHSRDTCAEERRYRDPRKDDARGADAVTPREDVNEERSDHRPAECGGRDEPRRPRHEEHDKNARKARTGGDADDVRVGERVAQNRLQNRAREGEVDADERRDDRARQADVPENLCMRRIMRSAEARQDFPEGNIHGALRGGEHHRKCRECGEQDEKQDAPFHG